MNSLAWSAAVGMFLCSSMARADATTGSATTTEEMPTLIAGPITHGGFGGPMVGYTRVNGEDAVAVGARGGWLINHRLVIGGGGWGIANDLAVPKGAATDPRQQRLTFGYGGFWTEYIFTPMRLVHGSIGALIGGGGLTYQQDDTDDKAGSASDAVFVVEPNVTVELNVIKAMRLALFTSYRIVRDVDLAGLDSGAVSGFSGGMMLKFGVF
ncbi:MAG TPA: hypothetical protein VGG33_03665 [Polyangia bacterium]